MFRTLLAVCVLGAAATSAQAQTTWIRPDLVIASAARQGGKLDIVVRNLGRAPSGYCKLTLKVYSPLGQQLEYTIANVKALPGGGSVALSMPVRHVARGNRIELFVDAGNVIAEQMETNNRRTIRIGGTVEDKKPLVIRK